ncbi:MAG: DUF4326 domain-containing protein [Gemmataceae bacterium]|nr:DUF4326 domain-containing protein [Gemmataceae bacterium]
MIRVVNVRGLNRPEQRAGVVYVGRKFAGWDGHPLGNPFKPRPINQDEWTGTSAGYWHMVGEERDSCLAKYWAWLLARPTVEADLAALWEATGHGAKPLGCWCRNATAGDGSPLVCHAQVLAEELAERFEVKA